MKIAILARKALTTNDRVVRQAKVLQDNGHEVTVVSLQIPHESLRQLTPDTIYEEVKYEQFIVYQCLKVFNNWRRNILSNIKSILFKCKNNNKFPYNINENIQLIFHSTFNVTLWKSIFILMMTGIVIALSYPVYLLVNLYNKLFEPKKNENTSVFATMVKTAITCSKSLIFANKAVEVLPGDFDIIQAHDCYALVAAYKLKKKSSNAKIIFDILEITGHEVGSALEDIPLWCKKLEWRYYKKIARKAHGAIGVGASLGKWAETFYKIKAVSVIRNCRLYNQSYQSKQLRKDLNLSSDDIIVIFSGSIYENANVAILIEVLAYLPKKFHVVLLGSIKQEFSDSLKSKAADKGVQNNFHILSAKIPGELIDYLSGADIGIIPRGRAPLNNLYSLPNKFFEFVMARLPIAVGRVPDMMELVNDYGIGAVFNEEDPADIAKVLQEMAMVETLHSYKAKLEFAAEDLCWEKEGQIYLQIMQSL